MDYKSTFLSKTFRGVVLGVINQILKLLDIESPFAEDIESKAIAIVDIVSGILIIRGLRTAEKPLSFTK